MKKYDFEEILAQAIGAGSACWENLAHAGVFQSTRAQEILDDAVSLSRAALYREVIERLEYYPDLEFAKAALKITAQLSENEATGAWNLA